MRPIDASLIRVPLRGATKSEAIRELLELMVEQGLVRNRDEVFEAVLEREARNSTAVGYGAAIPHARSEHVDDTLCAFGNVEADPIDFAGDGAPQQGARLLFLMISPKDDASTHLRTLAKISRLIKDDARRSSLAEAREPEQVLELLGDLAGR